MTSHSGSPNITIIDRSLKKSMEHNHIRNNRLFRKDRKIKTS